MAIFTHWLITLCLCFCQAVNQVTAIPESDVPRESNQQQIEGCGLISKHKTGKGSAIKTINCKKHLVCIRWWTVHHFSWSEAPLIVLNWLHSLQHSRQLQINSSSYELNPYRLIMPTPVKLSADKSLTSHLAHCPMKDIRPWEASWALLTHQWDQWKTKS